MQKEIPILFSTDMVRAILAGRKTVTRRILKMTKKIERPQFGYTMFTGEREISVRGVHENGRFGESFVKCPYGMKNDILWVRETTYADYNTDDRVVLSKYADGTHVLYGGVSGDEEYGGSVMHWDYPRKSRPSIHMPKEAARIWLRVKDVRVERLQDIDAGGAIAEGISFYNSEIDGRRRYKDYMADASGYGDPEFDYPSVGMPICSFSTLWEKVNGIDSWQANPWVWVVSFEVLSNNGKPENIAIDGK